MKNYNAYHFVGDALRDGSPIPENGVKLVYPGAIGLGYSGYHASQKPWQALEYAQGNTLCRVYCGGNLISSDDKIVCTERTIVSRIDAEQLLRSFARKCALDVVHIWDAPDIVVKYLKSGDETLRGAALSLLSASWITSRDAAWAAWRSIAWVDAWVAAIDAAWASARASSWTGPRAAAIKKQRARFSAMVNHEFKRQCGA